MPARSIMETQFRYWEAMKEDDTFLVSNDYKQALNYLMSPIDHFSEVSAYTPAEAENANTGLKVLYDKAVSTETIAELFYGWRCQ